MPSPAQRRLMRAATTASNWSPAWWLRALMDRLEAVEIDVGERELLTALARLRHPRCMRSLSRDAVRLPGERVVMRDVFPGATRAPSAG